MLFASSLGMKDLTGNETKIRLTMNVGNLYYNISTDLTRTPLVLHHPLSKTLTRIVFVNKWMQRAAGQIDRPQTNCTTIASPLFQRQIVSLAPVQDHQHSG